MRRLARHCQGMHIAGRGYVNEPWPGRLLRQLPIPLAHPRHDPRQQFVASDVNAVQFEGNSNASGSRAGGTPASATLLMYDIRRGVGHLIVRGALKKLGGQPLDIPTE